MGRPAKQAAASTKQPDSLQLLTRALLDLEPEQHTNPRSGIWVRAVEEPVLRKEFYNRYTAANVDTPNAKYQSFKRALVTGLARRVIDKQEYPDGRSLVWMVANVQRGYTIGDQALVIDQ